MMSRSNLIKIELFSRKQKDYPKWELKRRENNFVMAGMGHVFKEDFADTAKASEDQ